MTIMEAVENQHHQDVPLRVFESFDTTLGAVTHSWKQGHQDSPRRLSKPIISRGDQIRLRMVISRVIVRPGDDICVHGRTDRPSL